MQLPFFSLPTLVIASLAACFGAAGLQAEVERDVEYGRVDDKPLTLNLFKPEGKQEGLVVYVHGGGWRSGAKEDCPILSLVRAGYVVASVDYRLTPQAPFPANVQDIKGAIRFLRAEGAMHGIESRRIAVIGSSAGGHLAALVGVSAGVAELEGNVGGHAGVPSDVQAVVSFFGASNLETILEQSTEFGLSVRVPALQLLLGGSPREKPALARLASPVAHLDAKDPPILLVHGDADPQMPFQQSEELERACKAAGVPVVLHTVAGGRHGGSEFYDATRMELVRSFLQKHLNP
jgi:acetyl esterase/lipase